MKRSVEQRDLLNFHFLSAPGFSPKGDRVAYRVSRPDAEKNGYESDLWICDLDSGANRRMTNSGAEKFFCWSVDGDSLIFASARVLPNGEKPASGHTYFYSIDVAGGEASALFSIPHSASAARMLDQRRCLITAVFEPTIENPENADVMIFDQAPFMANGKGYIGQQRTGLGVWDAGAREFQRLTPEFMDVERYSLNGDRTEALFVGVEYRDVKPRTNAVYSLNLSTGAIRNLSEGLEFAFAYAARAEDWQRGPDDAVIVTGADQKKMGVHENPKFYLLKDGKLECLTPELDSSLSHAVVADSHYGCPDLSGAFFPGDGGLVCCATDVMKSRLYELGKDGLFRQLTFETSAVVDYCVQGRRVAFVAYEGLYLPELYVLEPSDAEKSSSPERRLTDFNRPLFEELRLSQPIHVSVDDGQGWKLDGWYMKPANFQEGKKYPTILHIHGGPKAAFGDLYHHEMQCWAARGYVVIFCNPRGGDGRSSAFEDIRGRYGDLDAHDLMAFTDWCVQNLSFVDGSRLGVTGGSYGGYMTNWLITQTDRFRAAVSQRGISNWVSKFGGCDIGYYYVEDQHLGTPWRDAENLWRESPLRYADRVKTPVLFIHSTEDFRCELNQGFQMFTALKVGGVETRMCVFRGENHELSRSGKPRNRLARLRAIAEWFDARL
ncbi:MAG: S9 family peptidase [Synergistaceae bacterium]|jgi:dipeptidyl aminopeptidase/acylaminoacyl peptidase|nr:S9 family peptidase [Synergistaceae bacterium]